MTWDGEGTDPWLPRRIEARAEIASVERDIRNAVWSALSNWLVQTGRRVLRGGAPPDLDAVWARVPAWREAVDAIVNGQILRALRVAYRSILGDDFAWEQRTFVGRYLTEVRNRLTRLPDEVFDLVSGQVAQGVNLGEGIPELAKRVEQVFSVTDSERWENRATTVARTEAIGAMNAGRLDAFRAAAEAEPDIVFEKMWISTSDSRTRPTHVEADKQRVLLESPFSVGGFDLMFPGDPTGPPQECIQCRCSMVLLEQGEEVDFSDRQMKR
jgi:hypothetical protein